MRSYVIDSKDQDLSYIPVNSFVYYDGCGFVKRKQTTSQWSDVDFERIYCTSNEKLNPVSQDPETAITLAEAEVIKVVVHGANDFEKGATITEITFKDFNGDIIPWDKTKIIDTSLSVDSYWDATEWGVDHLYDGNTNYILPEDGPTSSTLFNYGLGNEDSDSIFWIGLSPEEMKILDSIEVIVGSPDNRIPKTLSMYAVKNKDDVQTRVETLIYFRSFTTEIDGMRPATLNKASQKFTSDYCYDLFKNGFNNDGDYLVIDPLTGKFKSIHCEFPETIIPLSEEDPAYNSFLDSICNKTETDVILVKNPDGTYERTTVRAYLTSVGWVCEFTACDETLSTSEIEGCLAKACNVVKINPNATVTILNEETLEISKILVSEYIAQKGFDCNNINVATEIVPLATTPDDGSIPVFTDSILEIINSSNTLANTTYYKIGNEVIVESPADPTITLTDGGITVPIPASALSPIEILGPSSMFLDVGDPFIEPQINVVNAVGEITVTKSGTVDTNVEGTYHLTYKAVDSLNREASKVITIYVGSNVVAINPPISLVGSNSSSSLPSSPSPVSKTITLVSPTSTELKIYTDNPDVEMEYHLEIEESLETVYVLSNPADPTSELIPKLDINGDVVEEVVRKVTIVFDYISVPDPTTFDFESVNFYYADGMVTQRLDVDFVSPVLHLKDFKPNQGAFSLDLVKTENGYKKSVEWDEGVIALKYYSAQGPLQVNCSNNLEYNVKDFNSYGLLLIKPIIQKETFKHLYKEIIQISDGVTSIDIEINVTSHMRIYEEDWKLSKKDLGEIIVDDGPFRIPVFNSVEDPILVDEKGFYKHKNSKLTKKYYLNPYRMDYDKETNEVIITPIKQRLHTNYHYIIDPFFNYINAKRGLCDENQIYYVELLSTVNKMLYTDKSNFRINKYRFMNSKNDFKLNISNTYRDFVLYYQNPGLAVSIEDPTILGLTKATYGFNEFCCFEVIHGGYKPIPFAILTDDRFQLGKTKITFSDSYISYTLDVEIYQNLDINLEWNKSRKIYELPSKVEVGTYFEFDLLHPNNNNTALINVWSKNPDYFDFEFIDNKTKLRAYPNRIGTLVMYVGDDTVFHKIEVVSEFATVFATEYRKYRMWANDFITKQINLVNVQGTPSVVSVDTSLLNASINDGILEIQNVSDGTIFTTTEILLRDSTSAGDQDFTLIVELKDPSLIDVDTISADDGIRFNDVVAENSGWSVVALKGIYINEQGEIVSDDSLEDGYIVLEDADGNTKVITVNIRPQWNFDATAIVFDKPKTEE